MTTNQAIQSIRIRKANRIKIASATLLALASVGTLWGRPDDSPRGPARDSVSDVGPTSRPVWRGLPSTMPGDSDRPFGMGRRGPGEGWRDQPPPNDDEWDEIATFMRENSPVRLSMYNRLESELGVDARATQAVRRRIAARFRDLKQIKEHSADLYDFAFKQLKLEDKALDSLVRLRRDGDNAALRDQLKNQMREFVKNSLDERDARLGRLREFVGHEEASLAHDRADMDALQSKQQERFEREMKRLVDFTADADGAATKPADAK